MVPSVTDPVRNLAGRHHWGRTSVYPEHPLLIVQNSAMPSSAPAALPVPTLRLERLRFQFQALDPIRLPNYSGSAWRGLLGHSLRRSVCVTRAPSCDGCLLRSHCVYSTFFETPPASAETAKRYSALPHPFVLEPPPATHCSSASPLSVPRAICCPT